LPPHSPITANVSGGALAKVLNGLLARQLIEEVGSEDQTGDLAQAR
jgi:hypothetical protein